MLRILLVFMVLSSPAWGQADPLPSWNDTIAKRAIIQFVSATADPDAREFVEPADRIAAFDNDGTLWSEQPVYFQVYYAMDRAAALAKADPDWAATSTLQAAAAGDIGRVLSGGEAALLELVNATHSGMSVEQFTEDAADWLATAQHPTVDRRLLDMTYQPMIELLEYLRANGYTTYIVSGGGMDFIRAFSEDAYGIPPHLVIGTMGELSFQMVDGAPQVIKQPGIAVLDDKDIKPVSIARRIGKRPIFVGGNSDGDLAMLQWSTAGDGPRFGMIVRHTDDEREWDYDRDSSVGRLNEALDQADDRGWLVVDMRRDWSDIWSDG